MGGIRSVERPASHPGGIRAAPGRMDPARYPER
jgi:hypothetical protein